MGGPGAGTDWSELIRAVRDFFGTLETEQRGAKVSVVGYDDISEVLFTE